MGPVLGTFDDKHLDLAPMVSVVALALSIDSSSESSSLLQYKIEVLFGIQLLKLRNQLLAHTTNTPPHFR